MCDVRTNPYRFSPQCIVGKRFEAVVGDLKSELFKETDQSLAGLRELDVALQSDATFVCWYGLHIKCKQSSKSLASRLQKKSTY